jgi:hypothetical protein
MRSIDRVQGTLALAAVALLGSGVAGCGGDDTTTVTVTAPSAGATGTRNYSGTTSQGLPISFAATPTAVLAVRFGWRARCEDGQVHTNTIQLGGGAIEHGSFVVDGNLTTGGVAHVEGTLAGDRASGHLSRSKGTAFGTNCLATGIAWHARAGSG